MSQKFLYWLAVEENKPVRFSDLAHMVAKAMHPKNDWAYAGARVNLDAELPKAVQNGELVVRNALDMGHHTFSYGDALKRSVLLPHDLRPFLEARSIELRLIPNGSGPRYWTLENAAIAIAEQENWHDGARGTLLDQLVEAANTRELVVRDPHTSLRKPSGEIRQFYELVTPADVNAWLEAQGAEYRWTPPPPPEGDNEAAASTLLVNINGRPALPVRALPLATGDRLSPDQVVKQLGRVASKDFPHLKTTHAYHLAGGVPKRMLPHEWDRFVAKVNALEAELRAKYPDPPGKDHRGYGEWLERATSVLPAGVFVWLDEFQQDYEAEFSPEHESIVNEREGERTLNVSPFLEPETRDVVMAGFHQQPGPAANQAPAYGPAPTPAVAPPAAESEAPPAPTVLEHKVRNRSDPLAAVIKAAKEAAVNGEDYHSVWAALVKMAETNPPAPVVGYVPGEGVQYKVDDDGEELRYFKKDALRKRMNPSARGG